MKINNGIKKLNIEVCPKWANLYVLFSNWVEKSLRNLFPIPIVIWRTGDNR